MSAWSRLLVLALFGCDPAPDGKDAGDDGETTTSGTGGTDAGGPSTDDDTASGDTDDTGSGGESTGTPALTVTPPFVDFGLVAAGTDATQTVTLANTGTAELDLTDLALLDGTTFALDSLATTAIPAGTDVALTLRFAPTVGQPFADTLAVRSTDPATPEVRVPVSGVGVAPAVALSPAEHDFDTVLIGCDDTVAFTLANTGTGDLTVSAIDFTSASTELALGSVDAAHGALPWTLSPGESRAVEVTYTPTDDLPDTAYLTIETDDPSAPARIATITADAAAVGQMEDHFEQSLASATDTFELSADPLATSIEVTVDGIRTTVGWTYDSGTNSVVFDAVAVPESGASISIAYLLAPTC